MEGTEPRIEGMKEELTTLEAVYIKAILEV
jgi:hypothetical protein